MFKCSAEHCQKGVGKCGCFCEGCEKIIQTAVEVENTNKSLWQKLPDVFFVERENDRVLSESGEFLFSLDKVFVQVWALVDAGALERLGVQELNGVFVRKYMKV